MSIQIYLKYKYTCENAGFCILCIDDFKILKIFNYRNFLYDFSPRTSQAPPPPPHPQRPYVVSRGQNRYVTPPLDKCSCHGYQDNSSKPLQRTITPAALTSMQFEVCPCNFGKITSTTRSICNELKDFKSLSMQLW